MHTPDLLILLLLIAGAAASAHWKKLTPAAAALGVLIGSVVYYGDAYRGIMELALFFALGTTATAWKKKEKLQIKGNAAHQPQRTSGQVFANGGVAAIVGALIIALPAQKGPLSLAMAAGLSSATADTLSSELGIIYGRRCYNILTWKKEERGLDGVISIEGTAIGIAGSILIALAYTVSTGWNIAAFLIIILAGTAGNLVDSLLGAVFERRELLGNNTVNFLNTLVAALLAYVFALLTSYPS
ncbi:MAG TPA: DUF92 domain-containing protein [Puia sp.]|nr:DUF92 domain-containing protein [Puia sp.]